MKESIYVEFSTTRRKSRESWLSLAGLIGSASELSSEQATVKLVDQLIVFLNGPGSTGKLHVVSAIIRYCKKLCENLQINFNKQTVVVTAISGSAAVSVNKGRDDTHGMLYHYKNKILVTKMEKWKHAYLLIIDKISFARKKFIETLNKCLGTLLQH